VWSQLSAQWEEILGPRNYEAGVCIMRFPSFGCKLLDSVQCLEIQAVGLLILRTSEFLLETSPLMQLSNLYGWLQSRTTHHCLIVYHLASSFDLQYRSLSGRRTVQEHECTQKLSTHLLP
jgi:hypothetical protein